MYLISTSPLQQICDDGSTPRPVQLPTEFVFVKYSGSEEITFTICHTQKCRRDQTDDESNSARSVGSSICSSPICTAYPQYCSKICKPTEIIRKWIFCDAGTGYRWLFTTSCPQTAIKTTSKVTTTTSTTTTTTTTTKTTTTTTTTTTSKQNMSRWHYCSTGYYFGIACPTTTTTTTTTTKQPPYNIIYCYGIPFRGTQCPVIRTTTSAPSTQENQELGDSQAKVMIINL